MALSIINSLVLWVRSKDNSAIIKADKKLWKRKDYQFRENCVGTRGTIVNKKLVRFNFVAI